MIVQKQSIPAIAQRSQSHVHSIVPIVKKPPKSFFGAKSKSAWNEPVLQCTLGNMTIVVIAHDRWPVSIWSLQSFTIVTIAEAIAGLTCSKVVKAAKNWLKKVYATFNHIFVCFSFQKIWLTIKWILTICSVCVAVGIKFINELSCMENEAKDRLYRYELMTNLLKSYIILHILHFVINWYQIANKYTVTSKKVSWPRVMNKS